MKVLTICRTGWTEARPLLPDAGTDVLLDTFHYVPLNKVHMCVLLALYLSPFFSFEFLSLLLFLLRKLGVSAQFSAYCGKRSVR